MGLEAPGQGKVLVLIQGHSCSNTGPVRFQARIGPFSLQDQFLNGTWKGAKPDPGKIRVFVSRSVSKNKACSTIALRRPVVRGVLVGFIVGYKYLKVDELSESGRIMGNIN